MVIELDAGLGDQDVDAIRERLESAGWRTVRPAGAPLLIGSRTGVEAGAEIPRLRGIKQVHHDPLPFVQGNPAHWRTVVDMGDNASVGGTELLVAAGPCSVENRSMLFATGQAVRAAGARLIRGGAFKPRTSPYAFQGLGCEALRYLSEFRAEHRTPVVSEVMDTRDVERVAAHVDVLQVGARNMQNFPLLTELGRIRRPVLLKRGLSATIAELLAAAEYILAQGNPNVILCERGIRTFETSTRNTLDISAIPVLKSETHLPVMVDPSHAAGRADLIAPLACAAVAAGADGIIVEVHPDPANALSDGAQ
ncbi:MAG: 3-deoxy-7-phosphoheptulonate synthase, partial [Gemmatimonadales bacterium]